MTAHVLAIIGGVGAALGVVWRSLVVPARRASRYVAKRFDDLDSAVEDVHDLNMTISRWATDIEQRLRRLEANQRTP